MYRNCNEEDEFEPRLTPKPATKFDCFAVPSVPEVSLVFEKPLQKKISETKTFPSPLSKHAHPKHLIQKNNTTPSPNNDGSYAAWKEQNFSCKPSKAHDSSTQHEVYYNQNCVIPSYPLRNSYTEGQKETQCQEQLTHDAASGVPCKVVYQAQENNRIYIKEKHNMRTQCNNISPNELMSTMNSIKMCPNIDSSASYTPCGEYFPFASDRKLMSHNTEQQKVVQNIPVSKAAVQNLNHKPNMFSETKFQQSPHMGYPYFLPQVYSSPYSTQNTENQETIKNLLQLVNNQSEQIKSLQTQVDRLLKMHEENLKDKRRCVCSSQLSQQHEPLLLDSRDTINASSCVRTMPQNHNMKRDMCQVASTKEKNKENFDNIIDENQTEEKLQSKKTYMEQKVSIGVMTSFEFTVQNSPFALDSENYHENENHRKNDNLQLCNGMNICDTNDNLRRYKNSFTRIPSGQLENIVEDSESYLSSSQQQSSNLNASVSMKDLETQANGDSQREIDVCRLQSPKLCGNTSRNVHQNKMDAQKYSDRVHPEKTKNCSTKNLAKQKDVREYAATQGTPNYVESIPTHADQHTKLNAQRQKCFTEMNPKITPIDYIKHRQREQNVAGSKQVNCIEDSLVLSGGDMNVHERPPPTPEPSIHVDMHEYSSDDDSEKIKRTSKVGWTFYNNVLGQVNQILQNSCIIDDQEQNKTNANHVNEQDDSDNKAGKDTVKVTTLEQLRKLGISLNENQEAQELNGNKRMTFDSSFYPRLDCQANVTQTTSVVNETNTSMHMKALALKYLSDEQLAELALQRQGSTSLKHLMLSNVQGTNMSFATMRYLERYQLLPGKNNLPTEGNSKLHTEKAPKPDLKFTNPKERPVLQQSPFSQMPRTSCPSKILDISTLKQQPKLL